MSLPVVALLLAALNLLALAGYTRARRRFRQSAWLGEPRRLVETEPGPPMLAISGAAGGVASFCFAGAEPAHWAVPFAAAMAAPAVLGWAHIWKMRGAAALGLLMTMLVPAAMFITWGFGIPRGAAVGLIFGGAWMLWLAGFWRQQLSPEGPWTTAGELIPIARVVGVVGAVVGGAVAVLVLMKGAQPGAAWWIWMAVGALFLLRAAVMTTFTHHKNRS